MTTEAPWMRVYTRDWLARTGGLTPSDKGILSDLNAIMHERGEPVVFNEKLLAARCRATPKSFAKSVQTLIEAGLVSVEHGFLWSEDMQRQIEFQEKKSVNGKSAAKKRYDKTKQNQSPAPANAMPYQMQISDTEGQPPSGPDPSDTHSVDDLDAREATEAASFTRLDGAPDASKIDRIKIDVDASRAARGPLCGAQQANILNLHADDDFETVLCSAPDEATIRFADASARAGFERYLRNEGVGHTPLATVMGLASRGLLTAEGAHNAIYKALKERGATNA